MTWTRRAFLFVFLACVVCTGSRTFASRADVLKTLSEMVEQEQMTETRPFGGLGQSAQLEGIYRNYVRLNFHGKCEQSILRQLAQFSSIYSFVSGFVGIMILDAYRFGKSPQPSQTSVERIVKMYQGFHNNNAPFNTSLMTFFKQYYDDEADFWSQRPTDLKDSFQILQALGVTQEEIARLLLGDNLPPDLGRLFYPERTVERDALPADFDSTGVHLALGATLSLLMEDFPVASEMWQRDNTNISSVLDSAKQYAYRPFSNDSDSSLIDPRSYYLIRHYLDEAKSQGRDLAFLNTWAETVGESRRLSKMGKVLPWSTNILDVSVIANYFSGVISSVSYGLMDPQIINDDSDLNVLFDSSGDIVVHLLKNNFGDRIDLALAFYPSLMQSYWFIGRGLFLMENARVEGPLPVRAFERYYQNLAKVMRKESTDKIVALRTVGFNNDIYYDDFLGNADLSYYGKPIKRYEDRIFTTSMAANSLLTIWSVFDDKAGRLRWVDAAPWIVKETVYGCAKWLEANTLSGEYSPSSVFFSRDIKSFESLPFWYPANRFEYLNGTKIEGFTYIPDDLTPFGVQGYVEPAEYEKMLKVVQFGVPRPEKFEGFNNVTGTLLFWSSDAITYASVMMTISMAEQVQQTS